MNPAAQSSEPFPVYWRPAQCTFGIFPGQDLLLAEMCRVSNMNTAEYDAERIHVLDILPCQIVSDFICPHSDTHLQVMRYDFNV